MIYLLIVDGVTISAYGGYQDEANTLGLIEAEDDDPRYLALINPPPDPATTRDKLLALATLRIDPLQDAVDLEEATPAEIALLKKWKQFRIAVNRVDITAVPLVWPTQPA